VKTKPYGGRNGRDDVWPVRGNKNLAGAGALLGRTDIGLVAKNN
jgi:hypothetical protein